MAVRQAGDRLAHGELGVGVHNGRAAFCLWQHDGVGLCRHDGVEIGVDKTGLQPVHAHQDIRPRGRGHCTFQKRRGTLAGARFAIMGDRVLEIDDERVGAARHRLVELFGAIGWNEKKGTHVAGARRSLGPSQDLGRIKMNAWRRHSATSLLF